MKLRPGSPRIVGIGSDRPPGAHSNSPFCVSADSWESPSTPGSDSPGGQTPFAEEKWMFLGTVCVRGELKMGTPLHMSF